MNKKILTIIIPSYNTSKFIDECLPTYIDKELESFLDVLLIDDGANSDTIEKLKYYEKKNPNLFKYIHKENGGHGSVINYGIHNYTKTKYVKVVDGDDWVDTENLKKLCLYLINCDDDLVLTDYDEVYSDKIIHKSAVINSNKNKTSMKDYLINLPTICYKKSIFIDNKIFIREKVFYDDIEYDYFPLIYVKNYSYFPVSIYRYRLDNINQSVSTKSRIKHKQDLEMIENDLCDFYNKIIHKEEFSDIVSLLEQSLFYFFINDYVLVFSSHFNSKETKFKITQLLERDGKYPRIRDKLNQSNKYKLLIKTRFRPIFLWRILLKGRFL